MARYGAAGHGAVRSGTARRAKGTECILIFNFLGWVGSGTARSGLARPGAAGLVKGTECIVVFIFRGMAEVWQGQVSQGKAGPGKSRVQSTKGGQMEQLEVSYADDLDEEVEKNETFAREAAVVRLGELLKTKTHGDRITAAEIQEVTGFSNWTSFRGRILTWCRRNGFAPEAVTNDGYRLTMPAEHVDFAEKKRKQAFKKEKRGLQAVTAAVPKLDDEKDVRRADFYIKKAAVRVEIAARDNRETRKEFKLDMPRAPRRKSDT